MQISKENKNLIISFDYNPSLIEVIKRFDSRKFNPDTKEWSVPFIHVKKVLETLIPLGFSARQDVRNGYDGAIKYKHKIERILAGNFKDSEKELFKKTNLPLFDFQKIGTGFLCATGSSLLGDEPGLGKSIQSIATMMINRSRKNLIVCPSTLKLNWQDEIFKWVPTAKIFVVTGSKKQRDEIYKKAQEETEMYFLIINYELLLRDCDELKKF